MFSQHIVTASKKLAHADNASIIQRVDPSKQGLTKQNVKPFVPFSEVQISRAADGNLLRSAQQPEGRDVSVLNEQIRLLQAQIQKQEHTTQLYQKQQLEISQKIESLQNSPMQNSQKLPDLEQPMVQQLLQQSQIQNQKIAELMETVQKLQSSPIKSAVQTEIKNVQPQIEPKQEQQQQLQQELKQFQQDKKQQEQMSQYQLEPKSYQLRQKAVEQPADKTEVFDFTIMSHKEHDPFETKVASDLVIQANASFGSSLSKQLKLIESFTPQIQCYNYFYNLAFKLQNLFNSPQFYNFARKIITTLPPTPQIDLAKNELNEQFNVQTALNLAQWSLQKLEIDLSFMSEFVPNEKCEQIFKEMFNQKIMKYKIKTQKQEHSVCKAAILYTLICIKCLLSGCQVIKYDTVTGTLKEFADVYGAQMQNHSNDEQKAFVLLPQWFGENLAVPAYVRLQRKQ
ncbi:Conserved_hypothetical protein [Hexamita inflata]|uniref:Uncharacterized protein n=1 Tax=Hexamita inflata TaxID=28002 RepID=A0AA86RJ72_9EUKA|nr:Conserved hypothetical protein [Hexamita inflata]